MMKEARAQDSLARREFCHTLALGSVALLAAPGLAGQDGWAVDKGAS